MDYHTLLRLKGFLLFLKSASEIYGLDYLRCEDQFGVAPIYIADIYNQSKIVRWFRKKFKLQIKRPQKNLENVLLFNMIDNYKSPVERDWTCLLRYRYKYTGIVRNQILKCSAKNMHVPIHYTWMNNKNTYAILRSFIAEKKSPSTQNMMDELKYFPPSKQKIAMRIFFVLNSYQSCCNNILQNKAYYMMRKLQLFGNDDKDFYYRLLLLSVKQIFKRENTSVNVSNLFYDVYGRRYRHFGKLKMRSELHLLWLNQTLFRRTNNFHQFNVYKSEYDRKRKLDELKIVSLIKLCNQNRKAWLQYKIYKDGLLNI